MTQKITSESHIKPTAAGPNNSSSSSGGGGDGGGSTVISLHRKSEP